MTALLAVVALPLYLSVKISLSISDRIGDQISMKFPNQGICIENIRKGNIEHFLPPGFSAIFHIYVLYAHGPYGYSQNDTVLLENGD